MAFNGDVRLSINGDLERLSVKNDGLTLTVLGCGEYVASARKYPTIKINSHALQAPWA